MKFGIAAKLALLLAAVGILASGLTGFYAYNVSRELLVQSARNELLTSNQVLARRLAQGRQEVSRNLQILATHPSAIAALEGAGASSESQLATLFEKIMAANPSYFQIRLISASDSGLERVRVDRDGDQLLRVLGDDLQEKGHYPYVSDTLMLPSGKTYLSRIVINHERGAHAGLEQPTVLLATLVSKQKSGALGLIVINVDLNATFTLLKADLPADFGLYLTNAQGDYLIHPDASKTFGFDKGRRVLVQEEFPETSALLKGDVQSMTVEPSAVDENQLPLVATFTSTTVQVPNSESRLILGLAQPLKTVLAQSHQLGVAILQIVVAFFIACALLAVLVARAVTRPINAVSAAARNLANDEPVVGLPLARKDEIGLLAQSFKKMQDQIKHQLAELQRSREQLEHLAGHDVLTGLPNRRLFQDRLEHALARAERTSERFALLFIDVDKFKTINDRWGHEAGDTVLQITAKRLASITRKADTVARMGGDEFVILLDNPSSREQIVTIAEKLLDNLRSPIQWAGQEFQVGYSVGISQYPYNGTNATTLMASADKAMYETKAAGRNGYRFSPGTTKPGGLS